MLVDGVLCLAAKDAHELAEKLRGLHQRAVARVRTASIDKNDLPRTSYRSLPAMRQGANQHATAETPPPRPAKPSQQQQEQQQQQQPATNTPPPRPQSSKPKIHPKTEPEQQEVPPIAPYASKFATAPIASPILTTSTEETALLQTAQTLTLEDREESLVTALKPCKTADTAAPQSTNPFTEDAPSTGGSTEAVVTVTIQGNVIELDGEFFGFAESSVVGDVHKEELMAVPVEVEAALAKIETAFDFLASIETADASTSADLFSFLPPPAPEVLLNTTPAYAIPAPPPEPEETPVRKASTRSIGRMVRCVILVDCPTDMRRALKEKHNLTLVYWSARRANFGRHPSSANDDRCHLLAPSLPS